MKSVTVYIFVLFLMVGIVRGEEFPKCYFDQSVDYGLIPLTVWFHNNKTVAATSEWNFGDSTTSTEKNPVHTFENQCINCYVKLVVTRNGNSNSCARIVQALWVLPDFVIYNTSGRSPLKVAFFDATEVAETMVDCDLATMEGADCQYFTGWEWDFGDGTTSTEKNPVHIYDVPGNYTVEMGVWYKPPGDWIYLYRRVKMGAIDAWGIAPHTNNTNLPTNSRNN